MSSTPPLHRPSATEHLTLQELESEAARINREAGAQLVYLADRVDYIELLGHAVWAQTLMRRVNTFYWMRGEAAAVMSDCNYKRLAFLDLETSGLDRERCTILELGIVVTDSELHALARQSWPVKPTRALVGTPPVSFYAELGAMAMHGRSGLLDECDRIGSPIETVEREALAFLIDEQATGGPLCGAGVGFDRAFLFRQMPELHDQFHYRNFDVSTFRILAELRGVELPPKREVHRAIPDLEDAIELAKIAAGWVRP
jgi:oligoribonuclease